ncbi:MAG: hypothetical protein H0X64_15215 [Gemmatimonadaceae bacterium]|nr:hypothetical protein [Gemmatimonadaceae bacterium]
MSEQERKLRIIGREYALMQALARLAHGAVRKRHETTPIIDYRTPRGFSFDVRVFGPDDEPTGHIARITIELNRLDDLSAGRDQRDTR